MPTEATAHNHPAPEQDPHLRFYMTRDDFMRQLLPATQEEKLLATRVARAWMHLQDIEELIDVVTEGRGLVALYTEQYDRYKQLNRDLNQAERMWRGAMSAFNQARRRGPNPNVPYGTDFGARVPNRRPEPDAEPAPEPEQEPSASVISAPPSDLREKPQKGRMARSSASTKKYSPHITDSSTPSSLCR